MLHLPNLEEIEALLLKVPGLAKRYEDHEPDFVVAVKSWLAATEETLSKNRMPAASEIAVFLGELISAERGFSEGSALKSRMGARHLKEARAAHLLKRATDVANETIRLRRGQVDEAERVMMQIVAVADRLGLVPSQSGENLGAYLQAVFQALSNRAELASLVVHVVGMLGKADTLIMLDRCITRVRH